MPRRGIRNRRASCHSTTDASERHPYPSPLARPDRSPALPFGTLLTAHQSPGNARCLHGRGGGPATACLVKDFSTEGPSSLASRFFATQARFPSLRFGLQVPPKWHRKPSLTIFRSRNDARSLLQRFFVSKND